MNTSRFLTVTAASALVLGLAACGGSSSGGTTTTAGGGSSGKKITLMVGVKIGRAHV